VFKIFRLFALIMSGFEFTDQVLYLRSSVSICGYLPIRIMVANRGGMFMLAHFLGIKVTTGSI